MNMLEVASMQNSLKIAKIPRNEPSVEMSCSFFPYRKIPWKTIEKNRIFTGVYYRPPVDVSMHLTNGVFAV